MLAASFVLVAVLAGSAQADTLEVSASVHGISGAWTVHDAQPGTVLSETLDLGRRRTAELRLDYAVLDDGGLQMTFLVTEVRDRLIGAEKRAVMANPVITTRDRVPALVEQGSRHPVPGTDPVEFTDRVDLRLEVVPTVGR